MKFILILPHQLYDFKIIKKAIIDYDIRNIVIWECPFYFTRMNFNKKKLILHRASTKYYFDVLADKVVGSKIAQIQY